MLDLQCIVFFGGGCKAGVIFGRSKKIILLACANELITFLVAIYWLFFINRSGSEILFSRSDIIKVQLTNGNNGIETNLSDSEIDLIYNDLEGLYFKRVMDEETSGWSYCIDVFSRDRCE